MNSISLSQLTDRIQEALKFSFDVPVWIQAEISELRENYNGHCYLELIEKDTNSDTLLAKSKATIWSSTYRMLKPYFESSTGENLRAGLNIMVAVTVEFHGVYGFSLNIRDINPIFTIGELAARRLSIIRQLEADGIVDMNKQLEMPLLPQRLAIISSATAAGYDDFVNQLHNDENNFAFYTKFYPSVMQGEQAESSIIRSLEKIYEYSELFDVVVIIRGGGATTDLACFDSYELALNCAQFPLPIISGIGHQRDISILDMVAHTSVKTPTAAAEFLITKMKEAENKWKDIFSDIRYLVQNKTDSELMKLDQTQMRIKHTLRQLFTKRSQIIETYKNQLINSVKMLIAGQRSKLLLIEKGIESHSPAYLLKHGYTISTVKGKRISSIKDVKAGDKIRTFVYDGDFESEVSS